MLLELLVKSPKLLQMPKCNEDGCPVLTTGICINDFTDLKKCPHYSEENAEIDIGDHSESGVASNRNLSQKSEDITGYPGKSLGLVDINKIALENYTRLIILAGMHDVGKTTAILSLMHLFESGEGVGGLIFAGSQTLIDFEQKAWPSKVNSGNDEATTVRTPNSEYAELKFLHLKLADKANLSLKRDILFTDISGELFMNIRDTKRDAEDFLIGKRADHFALFLDAAALSSTQLKMSARISGLNILKSLTESGTLTGLSRLQIVYSRWDLFPTTQVQMHREFIDKLTAEIGGLYGEMFEISIHEIASRPSRKGLEFGYGLEDLFKVWSTKSQLDFNKTIKAKTSTPNAKWRQFRQYTFPN
jgi:Double-GTPase 2